MAYRVKYAAIALLCICVIGSGKLYADRYAEQLRQAESFLSFLSFAKSEVIFSANSVFEIVEKFTLLYPHKLPFLENSIEPVSEWVREKLGEDNYLPAHQKNSIISFFDAFGTGDEAASLTLIEHSIKQFEEDYRHLSEESREKIKLIRRLSFLAAAGAAILLI